MVPRRSLLLFAGAALLASGCSVFPGLRVLTGQEAPQTERAVESLDLVMADKSGNTDPSLFVAADRIEAASSGVDIIEIRDDLSLGVFNTTMLFIPAEVPNTAQGQREQIDQLRRVIETTWQAVLPESEEVERLRISLLLPNQIPTLDNGPSFIGVVFRTFEIDRSAAAAYLSSSRSLQTFADLVATGTLEVFTPTEPEFYTGTPNHPMFMMPSQETS